MRNYFSLLFCLILMFSGPAQAGPLEALSAQAYKLTGKKCAPIPKEKSEPACEPASDSLNKSSQELGSINQSLATNDEDKYFLLLAQQQKLELHCASDYAKKALTDRSTVGDLKLKLSMARHVKQKAQALGKKIASDPRLATPVCPQSFESLEGQYPKGTTKGASYDACKEWIGYRQSYQVILSSIPLSGSPSIQRVIDDYASAANEEPMDQVVSEMQTAYIATHNKLEDSHYRLADTLNKEGAEGLDRAARNELLADPALSAVVLNANPALEATACYANARYGEGADNLNNSVMVGSLLLGGGSAVLGKVGTFTARAFETSNLARATGMVSLNGMKILKNAALGADFASITSVAHQACFSDKLSDLNSSNACVSAPTAAQVEKDNCLMAASLMALGAVPQGMVNEISTHIKTMVAAEKRKKALGTVEAEWVPVTSGVPVKKASAPVVKKDMPALDRQLAEGTIVANKLVGEGIFGAQYVRYENGMEGVWKKSASGWGGTGTNEVAAYQVDRYLGLKSVPVTVKKEFNGAEGTVQYRVKDLKKIKKSEDYVGDPSELGFFDYLIANGDRHGRNYLQKSDGKVVAIDHGLAFNAGKSTEPLSHFNNRVDRLERNLRKQAEINLRISQGKGRAAALKQELRDLKDEASELQMGINAFMPQQSVVEKLRKTTEKDWRRVVGENLTDKQISEMKKRQEILIKYIDDAETRIGKDHLYPGGDVSPLLKTMKSYDD